MGCIAEGTLYYDMYRYSLSWQSLKSPTLDAVGPDRVARHLPYQGGTSKVCFLLGPNRSCVIPPLYVYLFIPIYTHVHPCTPLC